ncbi:hypothetical protein OBBRIDRAFT_422026 [Obba rivulosa]|uniref:Uncharacterized protein n=1 Tax=Obba rivulosa TaxID=1052685 RepID=A0A8E2AYD7_9APHY|nr:hypothetical protein OBBRIDRAFT_422026 [Obba rivulosa]
MRIIYFSLVLVACVACVYARPRSGSVARHAGLRRRHAVSPAARAFDEHSAPQPLVLVTPPKRQTNAVGCRAESTFSKRAQRDVLLAELKSQPSRTYRRSLTCSGNSTSSGNSTASNSSPNPLASQPSSGLFLTPVSLFSIAGSALALYVFQAIP